MIVIANPPITSTLQDAHSPPLSRTDAGSVSTVETTNPLKRTRKSHNKTRTGCLTCKIRRKKCDETKPACMRCTSTGRQCDGYVALEKKHATSTKRISKTATTPTKSRPQARYTNGDCQVGDESTTVIGRSKSTDTFSSRKCRTLLPVEGPPVANLLISPSGLGPLTDIANHCFSFFCHHTGPSFSSYFDSSIWAKYMTRIALLHPVVFSCATAVGAVHRRYNYGISRQAFEYCVHSTNLHKIAVGMFAELKKGALCKSEMDPFEQDIIMTCEMLLGMFQGFQGENEKTLQHMHTGIKYMVERPMVLLHRETRYCMIEPVPYNFFVGLFRQFNRRALDLFNTPPQILALWTEDKLLPSIPESFSTLEEARDFLWTDLNWIRTAPAQIWQNPNSRSKAQKMHARRMSKWSVSFAGLAKEMIGSPELNKASMLMRLVRSAMYLILYLILMIQNDEEMEHNNTDEWSGQEAALRFATRALQQESEERELLIANLGRMKLMAETILDETNMFHYDEHSLSFDSAVGPPKKRELVLGSSRKARNVMQDLSMKDELEHEGWSMLGVYGIAEQLALVEEHTVVNAIRSLLPHTTNPKWVDISCMMETRRLLLRYCGPDEFGLGLLWTQEWWTF